MNTENTNKQAVLKTTGDIGCEETIEDKTKDSNANESEVSTKLFCESCKLQNINSVAYFFCPICENKLFCKTCSDSHKIMINTRSHVLSDVHIYSDKTMSTERLCEPCAAINKTSQAVSMCKECDNELLCNKCSETHGIMKGTRSHVLVDIPEHLGHTQVNEKWCEPCATKNNASPAMFVCQQCENEMLCKSCSEMHTIMKATRSHNLLAIEKFITANEKWCEPCATKNNASPAMFVCQQCENEMLCKSCSEMHTLMKATRSHNLLAIEKFITAKPEEKLCEQCKAMHMTSTALFVCQQCENEFLCKNCSDTHKRMKASRTHVLVDIDKFMETAKLQEQLCEPCKAIHKTTPAISVCQQCENELLCKGCSETHTTMKATRSHVLLDIKYFIAKPTPNELNCDRCKAMNKASPALLVCQQCENELLCKSCAEMHKNRIASRSHVLSDVAKYIETIKASERLCDHCSAMNQTSPAVSFCQQCENEFLCESCSNAHKTLKATRSHALMDVAKFDKDSKSETTFCDPCSRRNISSEAIKMCKQCDNDLLCARCCDNHTAMKPTCSHMLLNINSYPQNTLKEDTNCSHCARRNIMATALYMCQQCDSDLLCERCVEKHQSVKATSSHKTQLLEKLNSNKRNIEPRTSDAATRLSLERKPGRPSALYTGVDTITLKWSVPEGFEISGYFQVSFKANSSESEWRFDSKKFTENKAMLKGFLSDCEYIFRVYWAYGETEGSYSEASEAVKTLPSAASKLVNWSVQSTQTGVSPSKLSLPTTEIRNARNEKAKTRKLEIGPARSIDWSEKTIMVIGETGTGKSTLVDGMVNYVLGVKWTDLYRLTIVNLEDEENSRKHNQALSQTEWITCYRVNHMDGSRVKYTLNIIDTPGFGDTRGLDRDNAIVEQIRILFTETGPKGILTIDAVCFLIKAPDARLTPMQRYIFQSIMSLFGKDIEHNICSMITFADGDDPPVFAALDESGLPFGKRFTFNNSGLYAKNTNTDQYCLSPMFWNMGMASFENFFNHLDNMQRKSLRLTGDVLNERNRLEATLKNLEPKLDAGLLQIDQLKKAIETFEDNQSIMKANKDFTYVTKKTQQKKSELPNGQHVTNCTPCTFTCHENCRWPDDQQKKNCCAMDANGYCTMCPDKCFWDKHANTPYIYTYEIVEETKTYSEMKEKYEKASGQLLTQEEVLDTMRQELEDMTDTIEEMMDVIMECNQRLADIALRPNPLTMTDHIDLMIDNEKNTKKEGWFERIQSLQKLKKRANIFVYVDDFSKKSKSVRSKNKHDTNASKPKNLFRRIRDVFGI